MVALETVSCPLSAITRLLSVTWFRSVPLRYQFSSVSEGPVPMHSREKDDPASVITGDVVARRILGRAENCEIQTLYNIGTL